MAVRGRAAWLEAWLRLWAAAEPVLERLGKAATELRVGPTEEEEAAGMGPLTTTDSVPVARGAVPLQGPRCRRLVPRPSRA